jgi:glycerol-3-phosphate dehydrogenase
VALGIPGRSVYTDGDAVFKKNHRYFFITPERGRSLIGTFEAPYEGNPDELQVTEDEIGAFLSEINSAYAGETINREDVYAVLCGLLPSTGLSVENGPGQLQKQSEIRDHFVEDGIAGLISISGVKYTTARSVAERAVDLVLKKLGRRALPCGTAQVPVLGGGMECFEDFVEQAARARPKFVGADTLAHLLRNYGSEYRGILRYCDNDVSSRRLLTSISPVIAAEAIHGIRAEMAQKLTDIIFRRTELAVGGYPGDNCLHTCSEIMAKELGWSRKRKFQEVDEVQQAFCRHP